MRTKNILTNFLIALAGGLIALLVFKMVTGDDKKIITTREVQPVQFANLPGAINEALDFTYAAELTVHAVVHVKTESTVERTYRNPIYEFFYGQPYREERPVVGFGSGVIISDDGYIVTNNHVIANSEKISVTLNDNRVFAAELIGNDPSTDIALIKIEKSGLPFIQWGDSEKLRLGEWILAVGNPFNLTSTVTAGIVSAKGRNLGILEDQYRIESFIQTDAALNRGNSGGALVNINGELVGINTAIISPSGGYAGNSFAVPVSIVKKVVDDLLEYGEVQRAFLGVSISEVTDEIAKEQKLDKIQGVYIEGVQEYGAAKESGIKDGDIILDVNGKKINSTSELLEKISQYRPGDKVKMSIIRNGKKKHFDVVLRNKQGTTKIVKKDEAVSVLGATFTMVSDEDKLKLGIKHGVKVVEISSGKFKEAGIQKGFIVTEINNEPVNSGADIERVIKNTEGGVFVEGLYPNGVISYYAFGLD
ncbi:MAG: Do family serine endopeptidase [Bacteroidales bacterium]